MVRSKMRSLIRHFVSLFLRRNRTSKVPLSLPKNRTHNRLKSGRVVSQLKHFKSRSEGLFGGLLRMCEGRQSCVARLRFGMWDAVVLYKKVVTVFKKATTFDFG